MSNTRHYSIPSFFRNVSNALLQRYFHEYDLLTDFDFSKYGEFKISDPLLEVWRTLPEEQRKRLDRDFQSIFGMGCEKGYRAIRDEAAWQLRETPDEIFAFNEKLSKLKNHYDRAMTVFLDYREYWSGATHFYHADILPRWSKRKNMGHQPVAVDKESIQQLSDRMRNYFHFVEGKGDHCTIEVFHREDGRDYFFAYPEDSPCHEPEWVNGEFDIRPHNLAFEVVFVYSQERGTLDLNVKTTRKTKKLLQQMFAETILKIDKLSDDPKDERIYDLNPLRKRNFEFIRDAGSGIGEVAPQKIRLSSRVRKGDKITLDADVDNNPKALYDQLQQSELSFPAHLHNITFIE